MKSVGVRFVLLIGLIYGVVAANDFLGSPNHSNASSQASVNQNE